VALGPLFSRGPQALASVTTAPTTIVLDWRRCVGATGRHIAERAAPHLLPRHRRADITAAGVAQSTLINGWPASALRPRPMSATIVIPLA
jgi:hypothetical protein